MEFNTTTKCMYPELENKNSYKNKKLKILKTKESKQCIDGSIDMLNGNNKTDIITSPSVHKETMYKTSASKHNCGRNCKLMKMEANRLP